MAALVLLVGPLLLFNPWFVSMLQARHAVAADFGVTQAAVDVTTGQLLADVFLAGDFRAGLAGESPVLDDFERSHMRDVSRLVRILLLVVAAAVVAALLSARALRGRPGAVAASLIWTASVIGVVAILIAAAFAVAFDATFLAFHAIFFPPDSYLFAPGSDLIRLFPQGFWVDAALIAGATVIGSAAVVLMLGLAFRRRPPRSPASA